MFSVYFVVNDDLGEPEKIIPDYEENGRYHLCAVKSFTKGKFIQIMRILHSLVHGKRRKPVTHCLRSICSLHTSLKVTVHRLEVQTTNVCAVGDFT